MTTFNRFDNAPTSDVAAAAVADSKAERLRTALTELHGADIGGMIFDQWAQAESDKRLKFQEIRDAIRWRYAGEGPEPTREIVNTTILTNMNIGMPSLWPETPDLGPWRGV